MKLSYTRSNKAGSNLSQKTNEIMCQIQIVIALFSQL